MKNTSTIDHLTPTLDLVSSRCKEAHNRVSDHVDRESRVMHSENVQRSLLAATRLGAYRAEVDRYFRIFTGARVVSSEEIFQALRAINDANTACADVDRLVDHGQVD